MPLPLCWRCNIFYASRLSHIILISTIHSDAGKRNGKNGSRSFRIFSLPVPICAPTIIASPNIPQKICPEINNITHSCHPRKNPDTIKNHPSPSPRSPLVNIPISKSVIPGIIARTISPGSRSFHMQVMIPTAAPPASTSRLMLLVLRSCQAAVPKKTKTDSFCLPLFPHTV